MTEQYPTTDEQLQKQTYTSLSESPSASYRVLETLSEEMDDEYLQDLKRRLHEALADFPELNGETVTVARIKPSKEYFNDPIAVADPYNRIVYFQAEKYTSNMTIYHELGHLAIRASNESGSDYPLTSEPFCSIFSVSRMPSNAVDEQRIPYLGKSPKATEKFPGICADALEYREENRNYIQKCKEWLEI